MGNHKLVIDVPTGDGRKRSRTDSLEVFVASLGSCVAALVAQYCERNDVNTADLSVDVAFDKADDPSRLVNLKVTINLPHGECKQRRKLRFRRGRTLPCPRDDLHPRRDRDRNIGQGRLG